MNIKRLFASCLLAVAACIFSWATNVVVDGTHVRLRLGASTSAQILSDGNGNPIYPAKGAVIPYLATEGNFYKVNYNGTEAYISRDYTHLSDAAAPSSKTSSAKLSALEKKVVGKHMLSLQWISWDYFGSCNITKEGGRLRCVGQQLSRENEGDYLKIDGYITIVDELNLEFTGTIRTKIYHLNGGEEWLREGTYHFKSTQGRRYWRMQEMDGPDGVTDYVDIYMKRK